MTTEIRTDNVFGRDRLIAQMWKKLDRYSLRFTAERRIGKTTVMQRMQDQPAAGKLVFFLDVEGIDSPIRFTEVLLTKIRHQLSAGQKAAQALSLLLERIGGIEVAGSIKLPKWEKIGWQSTLDKVLEGICQTDPKMQFVLMFDELPYMLQKIAAKDASSNSPANSALQLLDILRSSRMIHPNLRMIFAGSVGLHHVLDDLRGVDFASEPFNDMWVQEIGPLGREDAISLGRYLLHREQTNLRAEHVEAISASVADLCDQVPFYIERVIARLAELDQEVTVQDAENIVADRLADDQDEWQMEHFRSRLKVYYAGHIQDTNNNRISAEAIARSILDTLSLIDEPQSIDAVCSALATQFSMHDRDHVIRTLRSLAQDHYLKSDQQRRYRFRFPLLKRWWMSAQGLSS